MLEGIIAAYFTDYSEFLLVWLPVLDINLLIRDYYIDTEAFETELFDELYRRQYGRVETESRVVTVLTKASEQNLLLRKWIQEVTNTARIYGQNLTDILLICAHSCQRPSCYYPLHYN
jgi:hypothetical protein